MTNQKAVQIVKIIANLVNNPKGANWDEIMEGVSAKHKIKNWMDVRGVIQWMKDENLIVRTKSIKNEIYKVKNSQG